MSQSRKYVVREVYSEVLFDLAEQGGEINAVHEELVCVRQILKREPEFAMLLSSELIKSQEKAGIIRRVFEGKLSELTVNFLCVLARRGRVGFLSGISERYELLVDEYHHRKAVEVTLAREPDAELIARLKADLGKALDSEVKLTVKVDPALIGGAVIRKGDMMIDSSVRSSLERTMKAVIETMKGRRKDYTEEDGNVQ
ncbi:MAG: ATP synthase F1 subunit delta [Planctomycetes bacterium]|nr:ATP synthase F1 subunit delta [Planctomycetota bacterium]